MSFRYKWWGKGDIDASFGVFFDGFSKILSATGIMLFVFGMPANIVPVSYTHLDVYKRQVQDYPVFLGSRINCFAL